MICSDALVCCFVIMTFQTAVPELCIHKPPGTCSPGTTAQLSGFCTTSCHINNTQTRSHLARVLDDLDVLLAELVGVELQEPLRDLRQRSELWLLVDVLLSVFILEEALRRRRKHVRLQILTTCNL